MPYERSYISDGTFVPRGGPELDGLTYLERKLKHCIPVSSLSAEEWERTKAKMLANAEKGMSEFYSGIGRELFLKRVHKNDL